MKRSEDPVLDLRAMQEALGLEAETDTLDPTRRAEFESASAYWAERFAPLLEAVDPVGPTMALWKRIADDTVNRVPRSDQPTLFARLWQSLALWRLATAATAAAALLIAILGLPGLVTRGQPILVAVLQSPSDQKAGFLVQVASDRTVSLTPLGETPVPAGRDLQFWTKADADPGPTSLGLVPGNAETRVPYKVGLLDRGQLFEVTLEPQGGSPIGRPTGPILYVGRAVVPSPQSAI